MNNGFDARVIGLLRVVPGLTVRAVADGSAGGPDAILGFGGAEVAVAVQVRGRVNPPVAWQLARQAGSSPRLPMLVVADETTGAARNILVEHGIGFVDGAGNAHVELPGLLVHLQQKNTKRTSGPPTRLGGRAGVIAQALLLDPSRKWQVGRLAAVAEVSAGLAHRVLARLEKDGVVTSTGTGPHRVRVVESPTALLDLWVEENDDRPARTTAYVLAQTTRQLVGRLGADLGHADIDYAVTGAAAASSVAPFVTAVPVVELWVRDGLLADDLVDAVGAETVSGGHNVVFLQSKGDLPLAFRQQAGGVWLANRFRIYADLRREPRRGQEQAENLRREVIGF